MNFQFDDEDDFGNIIIDDTMQINNNNIDNNSSEYNSEKNKDFRHILYQNLKLKNSLLKEIDEETKKLEKYFFSKISEFPKIFEGKNFTSLQQTFDYLESISIPTKCVCAGIIDNIPGWKCTDCSIYENSIYCSECYFKSKELHKNHKVEFLNNSSGMCDCGDPDSLYNYCPEHCGPFTDQKQIDDYINKVIPENILKNIKIFLDDLFYQYTKYLLLTEKCKLFFNNILEENRNKLEDEKITILNLKNNFAIVFKNFMNFLRKITEKNSAMLHLMASYFLKNNLREGKDGENEGWATHSCIRVSSHNSFEILYKDKNANKNILSPLNFTGVTKHKCVCPFIRLFISNYRENVKSVDPENNEDEKFFLSFSQNIFLRLEMCYQFFFLYKEIILNNSENINYTKNQFFIEDALVNIAEKSDFIEETYEFLYDFLKNFFDKNFKNYNLGIVSKQLLTQIYDASRLYMYDCRYFTKPRVRTLMYSKTSINKRLIDIMCLLHNQLIFKSIVPHPEFQQKKEILGIIDFELLLLYLGNLLFICTDWENMDRIKEIFNYFVNKILLMNKNQKLGKNEFSYHISIYKYFGAFINSFCFNYAINNNTTLNNAVEFVKNNLFHSKEELNQIIKIILEQYCNFFGFVFGIRNGFFNYYEINNYNYIYFKDMRFLYKDLVLLKYIFAMSENPIRLDYILEKSEVENVYSIFKLIFPDGGAAPPPKNSENKNSNDKKGFFYYLKHPISFIQSYFSFSKKTDLEKDTESNFAIQWRRIFEMVISILKNDSELISEILTFYNESMSLKTKNILFERFKKNQNLMHDCRNMLKQKLILNIIANGNLMDLEQIQQTTPKFYSNIFSPEEFNEILEEITSYKMNEEKKQFFLKESAFKYLDMNYYSSPMVKSKAEIYITDFKKDSFKMYNSYYFSPSEITFGLYNKAYTNFFLCKENIELITNMLEILLNPEKANNIKNYNIDSIRNIMLPVIFNILAMFGSINSTEFYNYKINNENLVQKILNILNNLINANKENKILDAEFEENIIDLMKKINSYNTIRAYIRDKIITFNEKSFNTEEEELNIDVEKNKKIKEKIEDKIDEKNEEKKNKIKNMKNKLKNMMKMKSNKFVNKANKNKDMKKIINTKDLKDDMTKNENNEEIMCFYCRNYIQMNNSQIPYGKLGLTVEDYFYDNSKVSSLDSELNQILEKNSSIKENSSIIINKAKRMKFTASRISSCGHYFHESCFKKGKKSQGFKCTLCDKNQNILIPPLNNFYNKENFLKPVLNIKDIFNKENNIKIQNAIIKQNNLKDIVLNFLTDIKLDINTLYIDKIIKSLLPKYQSYINFLTNLIYSNAITFYKHQQIVIIKNLILSIRYFINIKQINQEQIIEHIYQLINEFDIINHSKFKPYDINYYKNLFDELLLCFCILFDYDELKKCFIFLINLILPFISISIYLRNLVINNNLMSLSHKDLKEKISFENFQKYLSENNTEFINNFKKFLHKFYIIKLTSTFDSNDDKIIEDLKNVSIEQLFSLLNMENIFQSLTKNDNNEIIFSELLKKIPELLSKCDYYNNIDIFIDHDKIFNSMINQIKENKNESQLVTPDFIIQFIPYKFKLISLNNEIFDFFEKYIFEKCAMCNKEAKFYFICLTCGKKVCTYNYCDKSFFHVKKCSGDLGIFIYINDMKLYLINSNNLKKRLFPIYVNESGVGPDDTSKGRNYKLSKEKYDTALKEYISLDSKIS